MSDDQSKTEARLFSSYWDDGLLDLLVGIALLAIGVMPLAAQLRPVADGTPLRQVEAFDLHSDHVGIDYRIYVALPPQYDEPDSTFPVIYNLDSDITFGMMTDISRMLRLDSLIPATVVVGIAYDKVEAAWRENRNRDLTPVEMEPNEWISVSGGGPEFLAFIEEELIPVIDARYRTDPADRTLSGASFAGLFTLYAMFEKPDLFHRYLAAVPSLWYGDGVLYQMEEAYARGRDDARARLYMSGEGFADSDWAPQYWHRMWDMTARLRQHEWENFHVKTEIMEGEHHASAQPRSFTRGLLWLFEKPAP